MPRARDWTLPGKGRPVPNHNPKLVPVGDIPLRLIEAPIVFETGPKVG